METKIFNKEGKEAGKVALPESVFGVAWNPDLVHEVVVSMQSNARTSAAHTKDRSEVSGGGKKPWRQKGTGRARHGSRRSPIWTGGGVAHGPRSDKDYSKKINKKVRAKAFASTLSKKLSDGEVVFVDSLAIESPKAAEAKNIIKAIAGGAGKEDLATKRKNTALIVLPTRNEATEKSFRNFGNFLVAQVKDINSVDLLTYKYVLVAEPSATIEALEKRVA
ncbi:50S ribosomal protein L4 [Candidatus Nomurabacteria bacterium]|nr:50S ribosomal protein L4 [Candidatus Nomurabacteria bacterium]